MIFERYDCKTGNSSKLHINYCWLKRIGRVGSDQLHYSLSYDVLESLNEIHFHIMAFYKYQVYKPFPVNIWIDVCGWLNGTVKSSIMDWTVGRIVTQYNRKLKKCPIMKRDNYTVNFYNMSLNSRFSMVPLLSSGRYRLEFTFTEADRSKILASAKLFFTISDNRLEQY